MATPINELHLHDEGRDQQLVEPYQDNYMENNLKKNFGENGIITNNSHINDSKNMVWEYNRDRNDFVKMEAGEPVFPKRMSVNRLSEGPRQSAVKPASKQEIVPSSYNGLKLERETSRNPDIIAEYEDDIDEFSAINPKQHTESVQNHLPDNSPVKNWSENSKLSESASHKKGVPHIGSLNAKKVNPIQKQIESAKDNSVINLPSQRIRIPSLRITSSITLKGNPGTVIEITDGPIVIDLDDSEQSDRKVTFCECTIYLDMSKQRILENLNTRSDSNTRRGRGSQASKDVEDSFKIVDRKGQPGSNDQNKSSYHISSASSRSQHQEGNQIPLFLVKPNSILEVRDCQLKSLVKKNFLYTDEAKYLSEIQDICFQLQSSSPSFTPKRHATLYLKSTTMTFFATFIQMDSFTSLYAQRCFFSESRGHSINVANPKTLKIAESIFEKSEKSSINIRLTRDMSEETARNITIIENEILNSYSYGISIFGENLKHQNLSLVIMKNRIFHSKKDAIGIKFLNISDLQVLNNEIKSSKGNGIYIHSVYDSFSSKQVVLTENRVYLSEMNGIMVKDSSCLLESNEIAQNNKHGVYVANSETMSIDEYSFYKKNPIKLFLNNCRVFGNNESGVFIAGILKGPVILNSCIFNENANGIIIQEKEAQNYSFVIQDAGKSTSAKSKQTGLSQRFSHVLVEKSEIMRNIFSGITIKKLWSDLFVSENMITGNKEHAIWIENMPDKYMLKLKDQERGRLKEYIQGFVGGPWGEMGEEKTSACKGTSCDIF